MKNKKPIVGVLVFDGLTNEAQVLQMFKEQTGKDLYWMSYTIYAKAQ